MGEFEGGFEEDNKKDSDGGIEGTPTMPSMGLSRAFATQAARPPQMCSVKDFVLVSPPGGKGIEFKRDESGFKQMVSKRALQELTLMADAPEFGFHLNKGDKVYVTAEALATGKWATQVFDIEGGEAVIVPINQVVAFKRQR